MSTKCKVAIDLMNSIKVQLVPRESSHHSHIVWKIPNCHLSLPSIPCPYHLEPGKEALLLPPLLWCNHKNTHYIKLPYQNFCYIGKLWDSLFHFCFCHFFGIIIRTLVHILLLHQKYNCVGKILVKYLFCTCIFVLTCKCYIITRIQKWSPCCNIAMWDVLAKTSLFHWNKYIAGGGLAPLHNIIYHVIPLYKSTLIYIPLL